MRTQYELEYEQNLTAALAAQLEAEFEGATGMRGFVGARPRSSGEYNVIGTDDRVRVTNTLEIPFRFICCLELLFRPPATPSPTRLRGSGTLISDRHVLTAAHNVLKNLRTINSTWPLNFVRPNHIFVAPARNDQNFPGHFSTVRTARVSPVWQNHAARNVVPPRNSDWALLTLSTPLGTRQPNAPVTMQLPAPPLAWWSHRQFGGQTRIRAYDNAHWQRLRRESLNICGYPADKCRHRPVRGSVTAAEALACANTAVPGDFDTIASPGVVPFVDIGSTQWRSYGRIVNPFDASGLMTYTIDTAPGHSGGPVWINWEGHRNLVGIHTRSGSTANAGVRISEPLLRQLRAWMRADGVQPTF